MPSPRRAPVGCHVPVSGGLARGGLSYAQRVGAEAIQVFVSNPRGWAESSGDPRQDAAFRDGCGEADIPVFVHAPYLINLGSPTEATVTRSAAALGHALARGGQIGAAGVVVHAGSAVAGGDRVRALGQVRQHLLPMLDALPAGGPTLLIELTAGGGRPLAARVEDLGEYLAALDHHPQVGICVDTCHLFAAGHDLAAPGGLRSTLSALVRVAGRGRVGLVHANDSKDPCGSSRDRHERVGAGQIGLEPLAELFVHPATRGVPLILETPGDEREIAGDLALLRGLSGHPTRPR